MPADYLSPGKRCHSDAIAGVQGDGRPRVRHSRTDSSARLHEAAATLRALQIWSQQRLSFVRSLLTQLCRALFVLVCSFDFVLCLVLPMHGLAAVLIALTARTEAQMAALKGGIASPLSQHLVVEPAICSLNLTVMMTCNYVVVCLAVVWVSQAQAAGLG